MTIGHAVLMAMIVGFACAILVLIYDRRIVNSAREGEAYANLKRKQIEEVLVAHGHELSETVASKLIAVGLFMKKNAPRIG